MKEKLAGGGAVVAAGLASVCCLGPLVLAGLGLGGLGLAAGLTRYRPIFLGVTTALLGAAFYFTYRKREATCADGSCELRSGSRVMKTLLWVITAGVVALATFPHYAGIPAGAGTDLAALPGEKVTLGIDGMTCAACANGIQKALREIPGVQSTTVSLKKGEALVVVDPGKVQTEALIRAVESVGPYKARRVETPSW